MCKIVVNYCHTLKERVRVLSENSDHGCAINMVSTDRRKDFTQKYFWCYIIHRNLKFPTSLYSCVW